MHSCIFQRVKGEDTIGTPKNNELVFFPTNATHTFRSQLDICKVKHYKCYSEFFYKN